MMTLPAHIYLECPNCHTETFSGTKGVQICVQCRRPVNPYVDEVLRLAFPLIKKSDIWGGDIAEEMAPYGVASLKPWLTEQMRFIYEGNLVTIHSTGQVYVTKPDGALVFYHHLKCSFGCLSKRHGA